MTGIGRCLPCGANRHQDCNGPGSSLGCECEDRGHLTVEQTTRLQKLCVNYNVEFNPAHYTPAFDLPAGWVSGWVGGVEHASDSAKPTIYVGVSPEGDSHS